MSVNSRLIWIQLLDKLVLSETSATAGQHKSLDYIPGGTIMGAVAARLYRSLPTAELQWLVFHSGMVRFGNAYPATQTQNGDECFYYPTWPVPLSLHKEKAAVSSPGEGGETPVLDYSSDSVAADTGKQYKQIRDGFMDDARRHIKTQSDYQLKTALDYAAGAASKGQLYGYNTLESEQVFVGELSWDEDVIAQYPNFLADIEAILHEQMLRLGRAKSAEFGRVNVALQAHQAASTSTSTATATSTSTSTVAAFDGSRELRLYCLSDLALKDDAGQATLLLTPEHLGLQKGDLQHLPERCFVRTRQYSVYNSARKSYDQQRQVIAKGSVFVFKVTGDKQSIAKQLTVNLPKGIGLHTETGLGQLRTGLYPPQHPGFQFDSAQAGQSTAADAPDSRLVNWLVTRTDKSNLQLQANKAAVALLEPLRKRYRQSRQVAAVPATFPWGPNKHNWSEILTKCKKDQDKQDNHRVMQWLFEERTALIRTVSAQSEDDPENAEANKEENAKASKEERTKVADNWQVPVIDDEGRCIPMANWWRSELQTLSKTAGIRLNIVLQLVARQAMSEDFGAGVNES